jgi:hypothetical protein
MRGFFGDGARVMGGHPYWYSVPYQQDIYMALQKLRQQEFQAGRYNPVTPFPEFPITASSAAPGASHRDIDEALQASDADGTRSILDISAISADPDYFSAAPLSDEALNSYFGTTQPSRAIVDSNMDFLEDVKRGHAVYIVLYKEGIPVELFFAGYSFD